MLCFDNAKLNAQRGLRRGGGLASFSTPIQSTHSRGGCMNITCNVSLLLSLYLLLCIYILSFATVVLSVCPFLTVEGIHITVPRKYNKQTAIPNELARMGRHSLPH